MNGFRMLVCGIGDAFSERHYSACFALEADEGWIQVDCPHPYRKILREANQAAAASLDLSRLLGIFLTHLHADHSTGLEGLIYYFHYILGKKLRIFTHADVAADLWARSLAGSMEWSRHSGNLFVRTRPEELYELVLFAETTPAVAGPFQVQCRPTLHSIPTFALRFEAKGRTLGYSADTPYDPGLIDWLADADLIVHEAGCAPMHTHIHELAGLPAALKSKMRLIHCPDRVDPAAAPIELLRQGELYTVGRVS